MSDPASERSQFWHRFAPEPRMENDAGITSQLGKSWKKFVVCPIETHCT